VALGRARIDTKAARTSIVERFRPDIVARNLEDLYQEVIHGKAGPPRADRR
jgi:hypothetical protein